MSVVSKGAREISLVVTGGNVSMRRQTLRADRPFWIGRDVTCEVVLDASTVSRRHAVVDVVNDELRVSDVSSNGICVNGQPLKQSSVVVRDLARIEIGNFRCDARLIRDTQVQAPPVVESLEVASVVHVSAVLRRRVHRALLDHLDLDKLDRARGDMEILRPRVLEALQSVLSRMEQELPAALDRDALMHELADEALGLGALEPLLADARVTEIMVVDPETIFVERGGKLERSTSRFTDDDAVRAVIERIVTPLGRRIDESAPMVDARLADGSRVNAVIPPLAIKGAAITIRRFPKNALHMHDLLRFGALNAGMAELLQGAVAARKNVVIAGGTGSGKTTLLNVLAASIGAHERVVTIEDAAELRLDQDHVVSLEARAPNLEGKGAVTIRDLVRNALRMRPDRIVVGECRGGEALDMLQAMNTGHDGSMTTVHANSPREAVMRLETLCLMAGLDLPLQAIRNQIAASVHVIVQQARFADGSRRVCAIAEVCGLDDDGSIRVADVYRFVRGDSETGAKPRFLATGFIPSFIGELSQVSQTRGLAS